MKKFKRLVALVLAGVLALGLLTACGTSTSEFNEKAEKQVVAAINSYRDENALLTNDSTLKAECAEVLTHVNADGMIPLGYARQQKTETGTNGVVTLIVIGAETEKSYSFSNINDSNRNTLVNALAITPENLTNYVSSVRASVSKDKDLYNRLDAVGVATRTINGKTYLAMAMRLTIKK